MRRVLTAVWIAGLLLASACSQHSSARPGGLTDRGDLLFSLEGLLGQTFGAAPVSVSDRANFSCSGDCSPTATYSPYAYVFAHHTDSTFHIANRQPASNASFGNYPVPVLIKGQYVACDRDETEFLVMLADTPNFGLQCVAPLGG